MKKLIIKTLGGLFLAAFITVGAFAQEEKKETKEEIKKESKITIKVVKEGGTVLDSTFTLDGDFDKEDINKMVKEFSGADVHMNVFTTDKIHGKVSAKKAMQYQMMIHTGDEECEKECEEECEGDIEVEVDGGMIYITTTGEEGEHMINIKKMMGDKDVFMVEGENMLKKEGNVMFFGDKDDAHSKHFEVMQGGHGDEEFIWTGAGENIFVQKANMKKEQIQLSPSNGGDYRLEFNSEDLGPIQIEVFNGEGKRLFRKKVKNFYGRFIKEIELEDNEIGFFTVKVLQGNKEIIGEFEFN